MADRRKVDEVLAELDDSNTLSSYKNERAAAVIRELLSDLEYFRSMPSLAVYVRAQSDRKKLERIEEILDDLKAHIVFNDKGQVVLQGSGEYHDVLETEEALDRIYAQLAEGSDG
jgi:hypothetical protein